MAEVELCRVTAFDAGDAALIAESERDGRQFMRRLWDEWHSGANRFDAEGEFLLSARINGRVVAMGGLNRDPYTRAEGVGRLRHLYVSVGARRCGVGSALVERVIVHAAAYFTLLRLRTTTVEAATFYERIGFRAVGENDATHVIDLPASLAQCRAAR